MYYIKGFLRCSDELRPTTWRSSTPSLRCCDCRCGEASSPRFWRQRPRRKGDQRHLRRPDEKN